MLEFVGVSFTLVVLIFFSFGLVAYSKKYTFHWPYSAAGFWSIYFLVISADVFIDLYVRIRIIQVDLYLPSGVAMLSLFEPVELLINFFKTSIVWWRAVVKDSGM